MHQGHIKGIAASPGVSVGPSYIFQSEQIAIPRYKISKREIDKEIKLFQNSIVKAKKEITELRAVVAKKLSNKEADIFSAHLMALDDPLLEESTKGLITKELKNAAWALEIVVQKIFISMSEIDDEYIRERAVDILDIGKRILSHIGSKTGSKKKEVFKHPVIIVAKNLTPSETAQFDKSKILGLIIETGSATSHVAILARALQVPAIVGTESALNFIKDNSIIALDGLSGEVITNPTEEEINEFHQRGKEYKNLRTELFKIQELPAITQSGSRIFVKVNLEIEDEIKTLSNFNHDGIGLCRTEFLYMDREQFPDENEQYKIYSKIIKRVKGKSVTIRTLDIGGDKMDKKFENKLSQEENPSLGCRGIRFSLRFPEVFMAQLRAILRASIHGQVRIMFPMISGLSDFIQAKNFVFQAQEELERNGYPFDRKIKIGIMIEVPSAALTTDILSRHVDFMSIGTNDLVQYVMASDRLNPEVASLYSPYHPAMIRILNQIITTANEQNCSISICGELASDEKFIPVFVGMGIKELSVSPQFVPKVRKLIRNVSSNTCENYLSRLLSLETTEQVEQNMRSLFHEIWKTL